jgi:hypothetical protein
VPYLLQEWILPLIQHPSMGQGFAQGRDDQLIERRTRLLGGGTQAAMKVLGQPQRNSCHSTSGY